MPFSAQHIKAGRLHLQNADPVIKRILRQVGPFTAKAKRDRFQVLINSIIADQVSSSTACEIETRLNSELLTRVDACYRPLTNLTPKALLQFSPDDLCRFGMSDQKANELLDLANSVENASIDLGSIDRFDDEMVIQYLTKIRGVSRWTAQMFLIYALARLDVLPLDDLVMRQAIQMHYELEAQPNRSEIDTIAMPWRPYATIACWYLWQSMNRDEKSFL